MVEPADAPLLAVQHLEVTFASRDPDLAPRGVADVSFSIDTGETLGIVGESGCGKSMTALALLGLLPPGAERSRGRLQWRGREMDQATTRRLRGH